MSPPSASPSATPADRFAALGAASWLGIALAVLGAAFFATKGIFIKLAIAEGIDPTTSLVWRMIVAVPIFSTVGVIGYRRRSARRTAGSAPVLDARTLLATCGVGALGYYVASYLDFSALGYISAQFDRLILMTYPFFVVLFGALFFRRRVTGAMIFALVISYLGIGLIFWRDFSVEGDNVLLGASLVFASSFAYAGYQLLAKPLIDRMGAGLFTSIAMSAAGVLVAIHFAFTHPLSDLAVGGYGLLLMLAIGTVSTVLPAYCISGAIGLVGPERTAVVGNISPLVTVGLAIAVLGEAFTVWHALGTAMVLGGVIAFAQWGKAKKPKVDVEP